MIVCRIQHAYASAQALNGKRKLTPEQVAKREFYAEYEKNKLQKRVGKCKHMSLDDGPMDPEFEEEFASCGCTPDDPVFTQEDCDAEFKSLMVDYDYERHGHFVVYNEVADIKNISASSSNLNRCTSSVVADLI